MSQEITLTTKARKEYRQQLLALGDGHIGRELFYHIKSRYRILYIRSPEERRVISAFKLVAYSEGSSLFHWDFSRGMLDAFTMQQTSAEDSEVHSDAEAALHYIIDQAKSANEKTPATGGSIFMLLDFHHFLEGAPVIERLFKEFASFTSICYIVIVSPVFVCPVALEKEFTLIDFPPPSREEVEVSFTKMCKHIPARFPDALKSARDNREEILHSTTGLTITEAENAYAKSLVKTKTFDIPTILDEKKQIIRKGGILEYRDSRFSFDQIGGLDHLKEWLGMRRLAFKSDARDFGLDSPKGVLLVGIPGCVLGDTKIRVKKISDEDKEQEIAIEEFFTLCEEGGFYQVETPDGWQDIGSLVRKRNKECYNLILENGRELGCSFDHYVWVTDDVSDPFSYVWKRAEDIDIRTDLVLVRAGVECYDTGWERVIAKEYVGEKDTFDLEVKNLNHRYYTNGILSHNTGKSMISDAVGVQFGMPLLRLDIGALFSAHIGESEENTRLAIQTAEAIAPCVLWIDKIEKGIGGVQSSNATDGGVTNRVFGTLLTWMQEKEAPVFVIATANNLNGIPPEFQRAGRFDEIFFLDLPDKDQRIEVTEVLLKRKSRDPADFDLEQIAIAAENYSPAEIEKGINNALFLAFQREGDRKVTTQDIVSEIGRFQPLYNTRYEEIADMREWAKGKDGKGGRARLANSSGSGKSYAVAAHDRTFDLAGDLGDLTEEDL